MQQKKLGYVTTRRGALPEDLEAYSAIAFWVYRRAEDFEKTPKARVALQFYPDNGPKMAFRQIALDFSGWKRFELPLWQMHWPKQRVADWHRVSRLAFLFHEKAQIYLDDVVLIREPARSAYLTLDVLKSVAFPGVSDKQLVFVRHADFELLSDDVNLDVKTLTAHFARVADRLKQDFKSFGPVVVKPQFLIFAREGQYRDFPKRMDKLMGINRPHRIKSPITIRHRHPTKTKPTTLCSCHHKRQIRSQTFRKITILPFTRKNQKLRLHNNRTK